MPGRGKDSVGVPPMGQEEESDIYNGSRDSSFQLGRYLKPPM